MSDGVDRSSADTTEGAGESVGASDPQLMFLEELAMSMPRSPVT
jgi:hypothetical protein